ncbi:MAG: glutathione S-transferase family protein [Polyangiaceae bacterium]|nr:glutathione S-transferase family protein [Polyangiaceae bacterium]
MGMLVNGRWETTPVHQGAKDAEGGVFMRRPAAFRERIERGGRFEPEPGRYHLYVSLACPWAHRTLIVRRLKGLEGQIDVSIVDSFMDDDGWAFRERRGSTLDKINHKPFLRDIYLLVDPNLTGKVTVPILWDTKEKTIVNNESRDIIVMLDQVFDAAPGSPELYPEALRPEIDRMIDANYETVNNGVYKAGFARVQAAYDEAVTKLFDRLDVLDRELATRRYLVGDRLTLADVTLFTTLLRFDPVYYGHFKCNLRRISDYENLGGYVRDLYQRPAFRADADLDQIKDHYYRSHPGVNPSRIVPKGPILDLDAPHGRDRF